MIRVQVSDEGKVVLVNTEDASQFGKWCIDIKEAGEIADLIPTAITNAYRILRRKKEAAIQQAQEDLAKLIKLEEEHEKYMQKLGDD